MWSLNRSGIFWHVRQQVQQRTKTFLAERVLTCLLAHPQYARTTKNRHWIPVVVHILLVDLNPALLHGSDQHQHLFAQAQLLFRLPDLVAIIRPIQVALNPIVHRSAPPNQVPPERRLELTIH